MHCEEKKGQFYSNLHKLINDDDFKYFCPNCREKKQNKNSSSELLKKKRSKSNSQNCKNIKKLKFLIFNFLKNLFFFSKQTIEKNTTSVLNFPTQSASKKRNLK
jgi:hypothetical protein